MEFTNPKTQRALSGSLKENIWIILQSYLAGCTSVSAQSAQYKARVWGLSRSTTPHSSEIN